MKHSSLLFCIVFASVAVSPVWSADGKKPPKKKPHPTVFVKKARNPAPKIVTASPTIPAAPLAAAQSARIEAAETATLLPTPWEIIAKESPVTATTAVEPALPAVTPSPIAPTTAVNPYQPPVRIPIAIVVPIVPIVAAPVQGTNPSLQPFYPISIIPQPTAGTDRFRSLQSMILGFLPNGIGQMHPPVYVKYVTSAGEKPILFFQISCPTKALFGFDTPIVYAIQLGVDQVIDVANATNILPFEFQKVCN